MNSLHINYWTHLNLDLTFGNLNTLPLPNTFFQEEACQASIPMHFNTISDDITFWRKTEIRIMWTNKQYHAAKEFE
jgi:hypothetical protein